jgi:methylated-DNA-[protein]-cysteine S-methyltransferase
MGAPFGALVLVGDGALTGLYVRGGRHEPSLPGHWRRDRAPFREAIEQLEQYLAGERSAFDLELRPAGTEFQRRVWDALLEIPFGATATYGEVAARIGRPGASRAVGLANGRNPISIVVPCHRVVGSTGSLTGYGGGLEVKRWLLDHESGRRPLA